MMVKSYKAGIILKRRKTVILRRFWRFQGFSRRFQGFRPRLRDFRGFSEIYIRIWWGLKAYFYNMVIFGIFI